MIIKLAFDPISLSAAAKVGGGALALIPRAFAAAAANQLHDLPHFISSKSNRFGKFIQRSIIADSIIAAKKGTEGKIYANRKLGPTAFFAGVPGVNFGASPQEGKSVAVMEANLLGANIPGLKYLYKGNKLQTNRVKAVLGAARTVDRTAATAQIAAPVYMGAKSFKQEYDKSGNIDKATKKGIIGAAEGGLISGGLEIPRRLAAKSSILHKTLSKDSGYGYKVLEEASKHAEKSMNRPKMFNYSNFFYTTPEKNLKGISGKVFGNTFAHMMGQRTPKGYDPIKGYDYGEKPSQGVIDKIDSIKKTVSKF